MLVLHSIARDQPCSRTMFLIALIVPQFKKLATRPRSIRGTICTGFCLHEVPSTHDTIPIIPSKLLRPTSCTSPFNTPHRTPQTQCIPTSNSTNHKKMPPQKLQSILIPSSSSTASHISFEVPYSSKALFPPTPMKADSSRKSIAELDREAEARKTWEAVSRGKAEFGERLRFWWGGVICRRGVEGVYCVWVLVLFVIDGKLVFGFGCLACVLGRLFQT
jgi:hypothetical protein